MVTPLGTSAPFTDPFSRSDAGFQPPFPTPAQDPFRAQQPDDAVEAQRRATQQAERRAATADSRNAQAVDLPNGGVQFRVIEQAHLTQARVVDRVSREVLREVPSTDRVEFDLHFDQILGKFLDVQAELPPCESLRRPPPGL